MACLCAAIKQVYVYVLVLPPHSQTSSSIPNTMSSPLLKYLQSQEAFEFSRMSTDSTNISYHSDRGEHGEKDEALNKVNEWLHDVTGSDRIPDETLISAVCSRFGTLGYCIQKIAEDHFAEFKNPSDDDVFCHMEEDDQYSYLMSVIAQDVHANLFAAQRFGPDEDLEEEIKQFGRKLGYEEGMRDF